MIHSHMPVRHLLKQIESDHARPQRDYRPAWVTEFIESVAELFEPLTDDGRVGFDCQLAEDRWVIAVFLGTTEIVGGKDDGLWRHTNFQFDVMRLLDCFSQIERVQWTVVPDVDGQTDPSPVSFLTFDGQVDGHHVRLRIDSIPPREIGPGFRQYPNGQRSPA